RLSFFFSSRRRHTRFSRDWSSDVCSSDLVGRDQLDIAVGEGRVQQAMEDIGVVVGEVMVHEGNAHTLTVALIRRTGKPRPSYWRSEERRVGKETKALWSRSDAGER